MTVGKIKLGKPSFKNLGKPRPTVLKAIGDTCIYAGGAITGISIANKSDLIAYISLGFMIVGNLFTNLYDAQSAELSDFSDVAEVEETKTELIEQIKQSN
jgi:hypothetical protein